MIIIRDLTDVHTLKLQIRKGDVVEIYNKHYDISKYYFTMDGILCYSIGSVEDYGFGLDYCYDTEWFRDIRRALLDPERYFIKLLEESWAQPVVLDEDAYI
jgi:hypothetical protein